MINNEHVSGKKIIAGMSWTFAERIIAQAASFVVSIIIARLLDPSVYGILALANVFIAILNAVSLTGFGPALIQKKEACIVDFSSTLYMSITVGICAYILLFFAAPFLDSFFHVDGLALVIRISGLILISLSINVIQRAYLTRNMQFNKLFVSSLFDSAASAIVGIVLAYNGYGVWALVAQLLIKSVTDVVVLFFISDFRPQLVFSTDSVKSIYSFGWKIIAAAVVDAIYDQSRSIVIGKKYNERDLAFYEKGMQFPTLLINNIDSTIANVLVSAISREQDDLGRVRSMVRKSVKVTSFTLFPLLIGMMVCSPTIISLLLTDKWLPSTPYMQLLCMAFMLKPVQTASQQGVLAIGRSDIYLKVRGYQKFVGITVLLLSAMLWDTPIAIAAGEVVSYVLFFVIIMIPNVKCINYSLKKQFWDLVPQFIVAVIMGILVYLIGTLLGGYLMIVTLLVQIICGIIIYFGLAFALNIPASAEIKNILDNVLMSRWRNKDA